MGSSLTEPHDHMPGSCSWGSGGHWGKGLSQAEVASLLVARITNDIQQETSTSVFPRTPSAQPRGLPLPSASPTARCAKRVPSGPVRHTRPQRPGAHRSEHRSTSRAPASSPWLWRGFSQPPPLRTRTLPGTTSCAVIFNKRTPNCHMSGREDTKF